MKNRQKKKKHNKTPTQTNVVLHPVSLQEYRKINVVCL